MTDTTEPETGKTAAGAAPAEAKPEPAHRPSAYEDALRELEQRRAAIERLKPVHDFVAELVARHPELMLEMHMDGTNEAVWIRARVDGLAEIQPLLAEIVRARYRPRGRKDWLDDPSQPRVMYDFGAEHRPEIFVSVRINHESKQCRFEKVGEKTVPILRIVCEGSEVAA